MSGAVGRSGGNIPRRCDPRPLESRPVLVASSQLVAPGNVARLPWATVAAEPGRLLVSYDGRTETIALVSSPAGPNVITLLRCPSCQQPYRLLYELDGTFKCRGCHRLDYRSRHEDRNNPFQKVTRLRLQIGAHPSMLEPLPPRPRDRAARVIYDRLASEIAIAELRALAYLRGMSASLEKFAERKYERERRFGAERSERADI